jgi:ABC-type multidrug transport system ATPase subunit
MTATATGTATATATATKTTAADPTAQPGSSTGTGTGTGTSLSVSASADVSASPGSTTPSSTAIETRGLSKRYRGGQLAVDGLDLTVPTGSVFGFLGPNGSGKTTTIRMLMGLISPTDGAASVLGEAMPGAVNRVLPRVGALIEGPALYPYLTGTQNLARLDAADRDAPHATRRARIGTALERVGLSAAADKKAKAYSLGMKQRLGLAAALLQPRELLILDEPTNGLDPQGMREIRGLIQTLAADGTTVFLSSHLLDEIEQVCTHAAVMNRGRLVIQGTVSQLGAGLRARLAVTTPDAEQAVTVLKSLDGTQIETANGKASCDAEGLEPDAVCAALVAAGVRVFGFGVERPSLEDAFVALTGEGFDVAE